MYFLICILIYTLGVILSIAFHVLNDGIDSMDKWNYEKEFIVNYGGVEKDFSSGTRILWASIFWFIYVPVKLFYVIILIPIYMIKKIFLKFLELLFNTNKNIKSKVLDETKTKQFIQKESKDYRSPPKLVEVCSKCNRKYNV